MHKLGMSVEASSTSHIYVTDIIAVKQDRYEHLVHVIKSMELSISREWVDLELKVDNAKFLALCSEMSHKVS